MSEPTAGYLDGREHLLPVRVYYEDTDFTGVVYHANYLRYFERGRSDFLRLAGVSHTELRDRPEPLAFVVRKIEVTFTRPARVDDALVVHTAYRRAEGPRIFVSQAIARGVESLCRAEVEVCCIRLDGRPVKPPADIVARLAKWFDPATP
jgi:acyl-CoA thioester hydrolase